MHRQAQQLPLLPGPLIRSFRQRKKSGLAGAERGTGRPEGGFQVLLDGTGWVAQQSINSIPVDAEIRFYWLEWFDSYLLALSVASVHFSFPVLSRRCCLSFVCVIQGTCCRFRSFLSVPFAAFQKGTATGEVSIDWRESAQTRAPRTERTAGGSESRDQRRNRKAEAGAGWRRRRDSLALLSVPLAAAPRNSAASFLGVFFSSFFFNPFFPALKNGSGFCANSGRSFGPLCNAPLLWRRLEEGAEQTDAVARRASRNIPNLFAEDQTQLLVLNKVTSVDVKPCLSCRI